MFRLFACCLAVAGAATSTGVIVDTALVSETGIAVSAIETVPVERQTKGDREALPREAGSPRLVTTVEVIGVDAASVILRDRDGRILFMSDPVTNTTVMARDTALPIVTVKQNTAVPVATRPYQPEPATSETPAQRPARPSVVGCEGVVSSLVNPKLSRIPGRCLVERRNGAPRHEARPVLAQADIAVR